MDRLYRVRRNGGSQYAVERDGRWRLVEGDVFGMLRLGGDVEPGGDLLAPVEPSKIVAIGLNYKDHAAEQNKPLPPEPLLFLKPSTAVISPGEPIVASTWAGRVDHEAEVAVVIGRKARNVSEDKAHDYILGLTCLNDVTARDLQKKDGQYTRCKGFDTFAPVGPCVALGFDGRAVTVEGYVNDQRRQSSSTSQLIFPIEELVAYITRFMTLLPGDIITTGTPSGIGPLTPGDRVTIKVEGVGELTNPVIAG